MNRLAAVPIVVLVLLAGACSESETAPPDQGDPAVLPPEPTAPDPSRPESPAPEPSRPTTAPRPTTSESAGTTRPPRPTSTSPPTTATEAPTTTTTTRAPETPERLEVVEIDFEGRTRTYTLFVPAGLGVEPAPLVVDVHGLTADPERQERVSGMRKKAAEAGFVVAQPESTLLANAWDTFEGSSDVGFLRAVVRDVTTRVAIDEHRMFVSGYSVGGGLAARAACDAEDLFAAVATVAGAHFGWGRCELDRAIPIIAFHGDADRVVPHDGGLLLPGIEEWAERWADRNGCAAPASSRPTGDVELLAWTDCADDAEVALFTVEGGGHGWPGTDDPTRVGDTTDTIDATDLIWEFFLRVSAAP